MNKIIFSKVNCCQAGSISGPRSSRYDTNSFIINFPLSLPAQSARLNVYQQLFLAVSQFKCLNLFEPENWHSANRM